VAGLRYALSNPLVPRNTLARRARVLALVEGRLESHSRLPDLDGFRSLRAVGLVRVVKTDGIVPEHLEIQESIDEVR
jgi:hypothetical protein